MILDTRSCLNMEAINISFDDYTMSGAHRCLYRFLDLIDEGSVSGLKYNLHGCDVVYGRGNTFNSCRIHPNLLKWVLVDQVMSERLLENTMNCPWISDYQASLHFQSNW